MINQIEPIIDQEELLQLKRVVDSTFVTEAALTKEFEAFFQEYTNAKYAIAYANGTVALYSILKALDIGPGDEVIVPDLTFIATSNSVIMAGARPVFCDIERKTLGLNITRAESFINEKTKAVMPVHLYGLAADIEKIAQFCEKNNLYLIEDAAQGVGVRYKGKHVGTLGHAGILSFYGNKTITCGEGGMILTDDPKIAQACYRLKNHGRDRKGVFIHEHIGFNFSFSEMQAAVGLAQCKKLERIIEKKKNIYQYYKSNLQSVDGIRFMDIPDDISPVFWFTNIFVDNPHELSKFLSKQQIGSRRFFYPLHLQPCYAKYNLSDSTMFEVTNEIYRMGLSLPSSYSLDQLSQECVIHSIQQYYDKGKA